MPTDPRRRRPQPSTSVPRRLVTGLCGILALGSVVAAVPADGSDVPPATAAILAWGFNGYGNLGDGTQLDRSRPGMLPDLDPASVSAGVIHSLAVSTDGTVWAWGYSSTSLGDSTGDMFSTLPVQVDGLSGIAEVSAGQSHSLALTEDGAVWAWGGNAAGQLGDGTSINRDTPVEVPGLPEIATVSAGESHTLALGTDGSVWAWGYNGGGALGDGTATSSASPVEVPGLSGITAIAAGDLHNLAVEADGTVVAWGYNDHGELGDGTVLLRNAPVEVAGLSGITDVSAGLEHSMALDDEGGVWTWGANRDGQLGDATTTDRFEPVPVESLTDVTAISAGGNHSVALADGTPWSWGSNADGGLGDGTHEERHSPVQLQGLVGVTDIAAGNYHDLAITQTHSLAITRTGPGRVRSKPDGILCGDTCTSAYPAGATVTLTVNPGSGARYTGWGGDCSGTATTCTEVMTSSRSVTTDFEIITTTAEETNRHVFLGGWTQRLNPNFSGGRHHWSRTLGDSATSRFTGSSLTWLTRKGPKQGTADVSIDGESVGRVNLYAPDGRPFAQTYTGLSDSSHSIRIVVAGRRGESEDRRVMVDLLRGSTSLARDSSPDITYSGWEGRTSAKASDGAYRVSSTAGATSTLRFTGSAVDWVTATGPASGRAAVRIDGVLKGVVNLYTPEREWQVPQAYARLGSGKHTISIKVLGTARTAATGTKVTVDAFTIYP